jgi:tetratricopeptide (TPR) repeat protein
MAAPISPDSGLEKYLSQPGAVFIAVEAGADAAQLKDLEAKAKEKGYEVLKASADNSELGYVFEKALPETYAQDIKIKKPAKLREVYILGANNMRVATVNSGEALPYDADIVSTMVANVSDFMQDVATQAKLVESKEGVKTKGFQYEGVHGTVVADENFGVAAIYEGDDSRLDDDLKKIHAIIKEKYGTVLKNWNGDPLAESSDMAGIARTHIIDSQKYTGEYSIDELKQQSVRRRSNVRDALRSISEASGKPVILQLDNLDGSDKSTLADVEYIARIAKNNNIVLVGTYRTSRISETTGNEDLEKMLQDLEKLVSKADPIKSDESVYDVIPKLGDNARKILQIAAIGASGGALVRASVASGMPVNAFNIAYGELQAKHLLVDDKVAGRKLAKEIASEVADKRTYMNVAKAIEADPKFDKSKSAIALANAYEKGENFGKAAEYTKLAADIAFRNANLPEALAFYRKAARLASDKKLKLESLEMAVNMGFYQFDGKSWDTQLDDIKSLEEIAIKENDVKRQAVAKLMRGKVCLSGGKLGEAIAELEKSDEMFMQIGDENQALSARVSKAVLLIDTGKYAEASELLDAMLSRSKALRNRKIELKATNHAGHLYSRSGQNKMTKGEDASADFKTAIEKFENTLEIARQIGDVGTEAVILANLSGMYAFLKDAAQVDNYSNQAIALCDRTKNYGFLQYILMDKADTEIRRGNLDIAREFSERAEEAAQMAGDKDRASGAVHNMFDIDSQKYISDLEKLNSGIIGTTVYSKLVVSETLKIMNERIKKEAELFASLKKKAEELGIDIKGIIKD